MPYCNATPHEITIYNHEGTEVVARIAPTGCIIRLAQTSEPAGHEWIVGPEGQSVEVPIVRSSYGRVEGISQDQGLTYIVGLPMLFHIEKLKDASPGPDVYFMAPDTGPESVVRDDKGNILGVRRFVVVD